jgi:hypothetical protein
MGVVTLLLDSRTETTIRLTTSKNGKLIELNIEIRCFSTCETYLAHLLASIEQLCCEILIFNQIHRILEKAEFME